MGNKITRRRSHIDDRYTRPQGLYQHKDIDYKRLRRSIIDAKLAPCYIGADDAANDLEECPICFLHYPSLNRSKCCTKEICTECFLQVKVPNAARPVQCPFCKTPNYAVDYKGAKTLEEKGVEQAEEQKVIEAKIRIRRQQEIEEQEAHEARLQRQEQPPPPQETSPPPATETQAQEQSREAPSFPVFSGSAYTNPNPRPGVDQHPAPPENWNSWPSVDSTAIGYPQPDFFSLNPAPGPESDTPWHRGSQRDFGRHNPVSSSLERNLSTYHSRRRGAISGEPGQGPGAGFPSYSREEDFDLDLEDIMVMEAIWLSIQEQGLQAPPENSSGVGVRPAPFAGPPYEIPEVPPSPMALEGSEARGSRRGSVTGGFASAIAALAERQVTGGSGGSSSSEEQVSESDTDSIPGAGAGFARAQAQGETEQETGQETSSTMAMASPGFSEKAGRCLSFDAPGVRAAQLARTGSVSNSNNNRNETSEESSGEGRVEAAANALPEQGLESGGAGTSSCKGGSSSEQQQVGAGAGAGAGDSAGARQMLPESFEEQMMLAMALSLAEAQAQAKCCKAL